MVQRLMDAGCNDYDAVDMVSAAQYLVEVEGYSIKEALEHVLAC
jgi:hypothetical protein